MAAAIILTGLSAGLCFNWSNTIVPGIARLDNPGFLQAFQEMNRAIINPAFLIVFFGPVLFHIGNMFFLRSLPNHVKIMILTAGLLYFIGLVLVTIFGNVPINEVLDKTDLSLASSEELRNMRDLFEQKWARLHLIRTWSSFFSFALLVGAAIINYKSIII